MTNLNTKVTEPLTSAQLADKKRKAMQWRGRVVLVLVMVLLLVGLVYIEKYTGFFASAQQEQDRVQSRERQVATMDCNAAMKFQADMVAAGNGVEARKLQDTVENVCTPTSEKVVKIFLGAIAFVALLSFAFVFGGARF